MDGLDDDVFSVALELEAKKRYADPPAHFECSSWGQKRLISELGKGEIFLRSGNQAGKTYVGAMVGTSLARGERKLAGIDLPRLDCPNVGWIIVPSYKQAQDSVVQSYIQALGGWPWEPIKSNAMIIGFYIKPNRPNASDNKELWSKVLLIPDEGTDPVGGRIDWAHADEPPSEPIWREVRFRGRAGKPFIRFITATPKERARWQWLKDDFEGSLGEWRNGRLELQMSVYDNAVLSKKHLAYLEQEAEKEGSMGRARLLGEYVDISGSCPFDRDVLNRWLERCETPRHAPFSITKERDGAGERERVVVQCLVETWESYDPDDVYFLVLDIGKGIDDGKHDPDGLHVWSRRKRKLVARFNGYLGGYGLGRLAANVARAYGGAEVDPAVTGGYGEAVLTGLAEERYQRIARDMKNDRPGAERQSLGFHESRSSSAEWRGAVERALMLGDVTIPSRDVVQCFLDLIVDEKGKILAGPRKHDEDWTCGGRAIYKLANRPTFDPGKPIGLSPWQQFQRSVGWRPPDNEITDAW